MDDSIFPYSAFATNIKQQLVFYPILIGVQYIT